MSVRYSCTHMSRTFGRGFKDSGMEFGQPAAPEPLQPCTVLQAVQSQDCQTGRFQKANKAASSKVVLGVAKPIREAIQLGAELQFPLARPILGMISTSMRAA